MIQGCNTIGFKRAGDAKVMQRNIRRRFRADSTCVLCEKCDMYHVRAKTGKFPIKVQSAKILNYLAQGYDSKAIADELNAAILDARRHTTTRKVEHEITSMMNNFYALNRTNLVAIAISLGIVEPNDFTARVGEPCRP